MNRQILDQVQQDYINTKLPEVSVGDTVEVSTIIREGEKQRIQKFKGLVLAIRGVGTAKMVTVRKISYGVGVEKIFPVNSPNVKEIKVLRHGKVRSSKIYYMRKRVGKKALKVNEGAPVVYSEGGAEDMNTEMSAPVEVVAETESTATVS